MKVSNDPRRPQTGAVLNEDLLKGFEQAGEVRHVPSRPASQSAGSHSVPRAKVIETTQPVTAPTVKVSTPQAEPVAADSAFAPPPNFESQYQSEGLPSNFSFYQFQSLHMRSFVPRDQLSIWRGRSEGNMRYVANAISASIQQDSLELTHGDFWYLMYQQRLKSYKKTPFTVQWTCVSDKHLEMLQDLADKIEWHSGTPVEGVEEDPRDPELVPALQKQRDDLIGLQDNITSVPRADLEVDEILPERAAQIQALQTRIFDEYQVVVTAPRMRQIVQCAEEYAALEDDDEREYLNFFNRYAGCLGDEHGKTMAEKRKFIEASPHTELLNDIDEFLTYIHHGVTERFKCKCKGCGIVETVVQTIDVPQFFPRLV